LLRGIFQEEIMNIIISGKVIRGKSKGKKIGFPTINIKPKEKIESGVYVGSVRVGDKNYKSGIFVNLDGTLLEAHVIGFSGDLYGKEIEVELVRRIRGVIKFENDDELKKQIKMDIENICSRE
jgi:riboflavin kinase / FMN adenylyltransferase